MPEAEKLFYVILSLKHTRGDYILWWGPKCSGYTCNLTGAGRYTAKEVETHGLNNGTSTMAILEEDVLKVVSHVVTTEHLSVLCKQRMYQTGDGVMTQVELDKGTARRKKAEDERKARIEAGEECPECGGRRGCLDWCPEELKRRDENGE